MRRLEVRFLSVGVCLAAGIRFAGAAVAPAVILCHVASGTSENGETLEVSPAAVPLHLEHGDVLGPCRASSVRAPSPVPTTGQTSCWDNYGVPIECAGSGQDGEYRSGVSVDERFTDHGNGTVTDNLTGLTWLKNADCFGPRDWSSALDDVKSLASSACGLLDGSTAGDWRLPNINELRSLVVIGQVAPALTPGHPFSGVRSNGYYWSSSSVVAPPFYAWLVGMGSGFDGVELKTNSSFVYVWPVRGGR